MKSQKIYAIIPAYNPGKVIKEVVTQTLNFVENIIIIDDGSDDFNKHIFQELKSENVAVLVHTENQGKGFALHTGVDYALANNADTIIMLDSDGQHSPSELPQFIDFSQNNDFQLVLGVRTEIEKMPLRSKIGNVLMVKMFNLIYRQSLKETQSGFRMMSKNFAQLFLTNVDAGRYETEMKMLMLAAKKKMKIDQIPIQTKYIDGNSNSKFRPVVDSLRVLGSFSKYSGIGFFSFLIDYGLFLSLTRPLHNKFLKSVKKC